MEKEALMTDRKLPIGKVEQGWGAGLIGVDAALIDGDQVVVLTSVDGGLRVKPKDVGDPMSASIMLTPEVAAHLLTLIAEAIAGTHDLLTNPHLGEKIAADHNT
jgi:hypothetical protein